MGLEAKGDADSMSKQPEAIQNEWLRRRDMQSEAMQNDLNDLKTCLTGLDSVKDEVIFNSKTKENINLKEQLHKETKEIVEKIILSSILETTSMVENHLSKNKNPYPYDTRPGEMFYEHWGNELQKLEEDKRVGTEGKLWIKRLQEDLVVQEGFFNVMVGMGASAPMHHDVVQQFRTMEAMRNYFDSYDLQAAFSKEKLGLEFEDLTPFGGINEIQIVKDRKIGFSKQEFVSSKAFVKRSDEEKNIGSQVEKEMFGLRELQSRWSAESFRWRMVIAAVGQYDPKTEEFGFMKDNLKDNDYTVRLVRELFTVDNKNDPNKLNLTYLNIYSADEKITNEKKYFSLMEMLITHDVKRRLDNLELSVKTDAEKESEFKQLISEVRSAAAWRKSHWKSTDRNIFSKLATLITKSGIVMDKAMMTAKDYCWHYSFTTKLNEKGEYIPTERNKRDIGSIYSVWDLTSLFFADRSVRYDEADNARNPLIPPSNDSYRYEWAKNPPNYKPSLTDAPIYNENGEIIAEHVNYLQKDSYLNELHNWLFEGLDPDVKGSFIEGEWRWQTCWWNDWETKDYMLVMPIFIPQDLSIENFWNTFTDDGRKLFDYKREMINGVPEGVRMDTQQDPLPLSTYKKIMKGEASLEDIKWEEVKSKQYDRWLVDMSMLGRYIRFFTESFSSQDPLWSQIFEHPSTFGPKKLANYIRLTFRDGEENSTKYELAFLPLLFTLATANKFNITSPDAWYKPASPGALSGREKFVLNMAEWKRAFTWLTARRGDSEKKEIRNYNKSMVNIAEFYTRILYRMAHSAAEESLQMVESGYKDTVGWLKNQKTLQKGKLARGFSENLPFSN